MAPVARSAFEIYQELKQKKTKKKAKKQHLHHHYLMADMNGALSGTTSQKADTKKVILNPKIVELKVRKESKKAVKRLAAAGALKPPDKEAHNKPANKSIAFPADNSVAGPSKRSGGGGTSEKFNDPAKKIKDDSGTKFKNVSATASHKGPADGLGKKMSKRPLEADKGASSSEVERVRSSMLSKLKEENKSQKDLGNRVGKPPKVLTNDGASSSEVESPPKRKEKKKKRKDSENKVGKPPKVLKNDGASSSEVESPPKQTEKKKKRRSSETEIGKPPKFLEDEDVLLEDSCKSGKEVLQWLLTPIQVEPFLQKYWEQRPLFISRSFHRNFFEGILSCEDIDRALRENSLQFTRNVDVTSYVDGVRETHNPIGRAHAYTVWDYYRNGCSVRILNPQTYFPKLRKMCTILQECFKSFVGANVYLTPPNSQGFAPHYDDIEAFVLQLEGTKKWKVYPPRKGEKLPRTSSGNFKQEHMPQPVLEMELKPGDLLYMPRGFVHQASTVPDTHSLHVTISTYQHNSWADVLEKVLPAALECAVASDPEFREGIPWDFLDNAGVMYSTDETQKRKQISDKIRRLFAKLFDHAPIDAAADQMAKEFLHESLPPMLQSSELGLTVHGDGGRMKDGSVGHLKQLTLNSNVKLVRRNVLRLVSEDDGSNAVKIYHCAENPLVYKEDDQKWCEVSMESAPAVEALIRNYPKYTRISDFPIEEDDSKVLIAMALWERGILKTEEPLTDVSFDED